MAQDAVLAAEKADGADVGVKREVCGVRVFSVGEEGLIEDVVFGHVPARQRADDEVLASPWLFAGAEG